MLQQHAWLLTFTCGMLLLYTFLNTLVTIEVAAGKYVCLGWFGCLSDTAMSSMYTRDRLWVAQLKWLPARQFDMCLC